MSKPKVLQAINELDENGFYNKSTYLGDIRTTPTCLDNIFENGIYVFTGGTTSPTDTKGEYKWSLRVYADEDCTSAEQEAEKLDATSYRIKFVRYYVNSAWSTFIAYDDLFIATYGETTFTEIQTAINVGKSVIVRYGPKIGVLVSSDDLTLAFQYFNGTKYETYKLLSTGGWTTSTGTLLPLEGGTMTGALVAQTNTNYTIKQMRNIIILPEDAEIPTGQSGDICIIYSSDVVT